MYIRESGAPYPRAKLLPPHPVGGEGRALGARRGQGNRRSRLFRAQQVLAPVGKGTGRALGGCSKHDACSATLVARCSMLPDLPKPGSTTFPISRAARDLTRVVVDGWGNCKDCGRSGCHKQETVSWAGNA